MDRRGVSHIEAIISFLLFIGFIFVAIYFFSPTGNANLIDSSLQYTLNEISEQTTIELMTFSIKLNSASIPPSQKTVAVEFPPEVIPIPASYKARAETYDGKVLPTTRSGNIVYFDRQGQDFVLIKFSEDYPDGTPATESPALDSSLYRVASSSSRYVMSEKRLLELNTSYYQDYDQLKESLNLPGQTTFGYAVQIGNYSIAGPIQVPVGVDVYSTIARREMLKTTGETLFGEVSVRVW